MNCIECGAQQTFVIDSRLIENYTIKRRRECKECGKRFNTLEKPDLVEINVIKRNKSITLFNRDKIKDGLMRAFNKLDYNEEQISLLVDEIENEIREKYKKSITTNEIGQIILNKLRLTNEVAYIRFASVYNKFENIDSFIELVNNMKCNKE